MSRGFVKEEDQEEIPVVPPRAHLPESAVNYVTEVGLQELLHEKETLIEQRDTLAAINDNERRIAHNHINSKLNLLNNRIVTAKVVALDKQPQDRIRFGALVTLRINNDKKLQQYQIVGVDEANIAKKKISFISPIAKALTDKKVGERAILKLETGERVFEIMAIIYKI